MDFWARSLYNFMSMLYCMSKSMLRTHVHAACPSICCVFHVYAACPCPCCMSMSILHVHVHAACPCPCCMSISLLHVQINAACSSPCSMDMDMPYELGPCCMSISMFMLHVQVHVARTWTCRVDIAMQRAYVHAVYPWPCFLFSSMHIDKDVQYDARVQAVCLGLCCMPMSMLHGPVHAARPWIWACSMDTGMQHGQGRDLDIDHYWTSMDSFIGFIFRRFCGRVSGS
jgi:hypothetical protein